MTVFVVAIPHRRVAGHSSPDRAVKKVTWEMRTNIREAPFNHVVLDKRSYQYGERAKTHGREGKRTKENQGKTW